MDSPLQEDKQLNFQIPILQRTKRNQANYKEYTDHDAQTHFFPIRTKSCSTQSKQWPLSLLRLSGQS
jgi:hypothetical protein